MWRVLVLLGILAACDRGGSGGAGSGSAGPPRVVSLTPSATEVVAALGATSLLVGVDSYSKYPPEVEQLPKVGDFLHPNLEAIVRLAPTLVIVDDIHGATADALRDRHVETVECAMHGLHDVEAALRTVGARLGRSAKADELNTAIEQTIADATAHRPAKHPRVLVVIDREANGLRNLVAAGPGSWLDELLVVVGGDNVLAGSGRYPKISVEEVVRAQPDVILDGSFADDPTSVWNELDVPAVKTGKIFRLREPYLTSPSPRIREAIVALAKLVQ